MFLFTHFACNEAAAASMAIESSQDNTENSVVTPRFTAAFKNTDIREFINIVSKNLHKTIIIDSQVQGEVSVHSYEQLTADQYYQFFLNVLEVYGYTVITNSDNILKVVPSEKGQRAALTAQQKNSTARTSWSASCRCKTSQAIRLRRSSTSSTTTWAWAAFATISQATRC